MSSKNKKNVKKEINALSVKNNNPLENISNDDLNNNKNEVPTKNIKGNQNNEENSMNNKKNKKNNKKTKSNKKEIKEESKINNEKEIKEVVEEKKVEVIETKIVDELPKNDVIENKIKKNIIYKIVFVFHNQDYILSFKPEIKMLNVIKKISQKLNVPTEKLSLNYKDYEISDKYNNLTIKEFFNFPKNKSRPIIYVKTKQTETSPNNNLSTDFEKYNIFYKRSYDHKVKIMNYPSLTDINIGANDDIYNVINTFLKETGITSDFTCERKDENENKKVNKDKLLTENNDNSNNNEINSNLNSDINANLEEIKTEPNINSNNIIYYIGFPSPDIAFDFNRYMNSLRLMNPTFKNIKIQILLSRKKSLKKIKKINTNQKDNDNSNYKINYNYRYGTPLNLDEKDLDKRNIEILNIIRNNFLNNKMNGLIKGSNYSYLSTSSPYSTPYDERIKDMHENKKKWLSPKGFISSVNKYSGVHI